MKLFTLLSLLLTLNLQASGGGGIFFYATAHQEIIRQCIAKAKLKDYQQLPQNLVELLDYSEVEVKFEFGGHNHFFSFAENFEDIIDIHFFNEPEKFDVERSPNPHLSFGHGIHLCLGITLARLELRVVLTRLFTKFENIQLVTEQPDWGDEMTFRGIRSLFIEVKSNVGM